MAKTFINIHHTATFAKDDVTHQFNGVNVGHKKRWNGETLSKLGFYGGYHYLVERDGSIFQFRGDEEVGAHNNVSGMNQKALGVCFAGNMSEQDLTAAQIESGYRLISELMNKYGIPEGNIDPHKYYKNTQCPGNRLTDDPWPYIKSQFIRQPDKPIVAWHKKHQIIEKWSNPPTEAEITLGFAVYKGLRALAEAQANQDTNFFTLEI